VEFDVTHRVHGELVIVTAAGEIDVFTSPRLRDTLQQLISEGHVHLVVDLHDVEFLDSTGLGVLVGIFHRLRALDGSMVFTSPTERVSKIFIAAGLTKVFKLHPDLDAALAASPAYPGQMTADAEPASEEEGGRGQT